jgi:hypothetical protein
VDVINLVAKANVLTHDQANKLENERKTKKKFLHESDNSGKSTNSQGNSQQNQNYVLFTISLNRYGLFCDSKLYIYLERNGGEFDMFG